MIWESHPWKVALLRDVDIIERWAKRAPTERQSILLEKKLMISAYVMRRLIEARKVATELIEAEFNIERFPSLGRSVTMMNWHQVDELYNFSEGCEIKDRFVNVINRIMHSYVLVFSLDEQHGTDGVLVTSDRYRNKFVDKILLDSYIDLARRFGSSYPAFTNRSFNAKSGDYELQSWDGNLWR